MSKRYLYLLEAIRDGTDYQKGMRIWAYQRCSGWRVISVTRVK